jgi:WD40 repeat protein
MAEHPEGRTQLEHFQRRRHGARYVSVTWWSDHQRHKHVRIASGDTDSSDWHPHYSRLDHDLRPPLWHVHGERLFRVRRPGRDSTWVACCACGVTGEPAALAWMGPRCGPCHDRVEEGLPHPEEGTPALVGTPHGTVYAVAFAPDGRSVASSSSRRRVTIHSLEGLPPRCVYRGDDAEEDEEYRPLLFSHDGRQLAAGDPEAPGLLVWDLASHEKGEGQQQLLYLEETPTEQVVGLAFSPTETLLAACDRSGIVTAWEFDEANESWNQVHTRHNRATALAFAPDGLTLAVGLREGGLIELLTLPLWVRRDSFRSADRSDEVLFLQYTPSGSHLVLITGSLDPEGDQTPHHLRLWDVAHGREERSARVPFGVIAVALSPDGTHLAWIVHDLQHSPGEITFWDVARWREAGRLEWDPEDPLSDLAFSPDGQNLVTGSRAGVLKLWPWRLLLET